MCLTNLAGTPAQTCPGGMVLCLGKTARLANTQSSLSVEPGIMIEPPPTTPRSPMVTHMEGSEVHAMNMRDHSMMILPMEDGLNIEAGKEIMWMEALGRYKIIRDH